MQSATATATTKISFEEALAAYNNNNNNNDNNTNSKHPITSSSKRNAHIGQNDKTKVPPFPPSSPPPRPRKVAFAMASATECTRDLPEHIQELLVFEEDPEDRSNSEEEAACARKTVLNTLFRCQYCYQYYDHVRQWVPPWQDIYRLRCNRHRDKSFLYWCKAQQRGFPSKRAVADYCNSTTTITSTTTGPGSSPGGLIGYSWSYHQSDDSATECVNANYHQRESLTYQDRRTQTHQTQKHTRTQNPFVSWTYQQDTTTDDQRGCDIDVNGLRLFGTTSSSSSSSSSSKIKNKNKTRNTD